MRRIVLQGDSVDGGGRNNAIQIPTTAVASREGTAMASMGQKIAS